MSGPTNPLEFILVFGKSQDLGDFITEKVRIISVNSIHTGWFSSKVLIKKQVFEAILGQSTQKTAKMR